MLCVCLDDGVKCVVFVSVLFLKLLKCEKYMREKMSWFCLIYTTLTVFWQWNSEKEIRKLLWCYHLWFLLSKTNFGVYRNDGLTFLRNLNGQQMDKKRKTIIKIFKNIGFSTGIQTNLKVVDYKTVLNVHTSTLTIICFISAHRRTIRGKSLNS